MATIKCPHCGAIIEAQVFVDGAVAMCFKCHEHFTMTAECVAPAAAEAASSFEYDQEEADRINPPHYKNGFPQKVIECIDVVQFLPFCIGNAVKYVWRAGKKQHADWREDLAKARWYMNRWINISLRTRDYPEAQGVLRGVDLGALNSLEKARLECIHVILSGQYKGEEMIDAFEAALSKWMAAGK